MEDNSYISNFNYTMKKFYLYLFAVLVGTVAIDLFYRTICLYFFKEPDATSRIAFQYRFISVSEPCDLAFIGASRSNHHYSPQQIEDSLNIKVYNYGNDGSTILFHYLSLIKAIENGGLKMVIYDLSPGQIGDVWVKESISNLYPYYWQNDSVRNAVDEAEGKCISFAMLSALFQYNSQMINMMMKATPTEKGFIPLKYTGKTALIEQDEYKNGRPESFYGELGKKYLKKMVDICKKNGIKFVVASSPYLTISENDVKYMSNLCKTLGVDYWDMTGLIKDPLLYKDRSHLNAKGAELLTEYVVDRLKKEYGELLSNNK